ncbi:MAG: type II secretion system F family protein [Actinomycetota bacterium]
MSALAIVLLGLAAWFAELGSRSVRRSRLDRMLGHSPDRGTRSWMRSSVPGWMVWSVAGASASWLLFGPVTGIAGGVAGCIAWHVRLRRRTRSVAAERDEQVVDAVVSVTAAIRAGQSVPQALAFAATESAPPVRDSLRRLDGSVQVGVPLEQALHDWTTEVGTDDARLVAGVLGLHRRSGGDLPAVLDQVVETLRERRAAAREVRALTAQARLSGTILGVLPFGFFAFLWLTSRSDIEGALRSPAGLAVIGLGLVLEALAFLWIRSLLEVR